MTGKIGEYRDISSLRSDYIVTEDPLPPLVVQGLPAKILLVLCDVVVDLILQLALNDI